MRLECARALERRPHPAAVAHGDTFPKAGIDRGGRVVINHSNMIIDRPSPLRLPAKLASIYVNCTVNPIPCHKFSAYRSTCPSCRASVGPPIPFRFFLRAIRTLCLVEFELRRVQLWIVRQVADVGFNASLRKASPTRPIINSIVPRRSASAGIPLMRRSLSYPVATSWRINVRCRHGSNLPSTCRFLAQRSSPPPSLSRSVPHSSLSSAFARLNNVSWRQD